MLEGLIFMFLMFLGVISLIIALIELTIALVNKSPKQKKKAFKIGIIPTFCFGLLAFWHLLLVPSLNKSKMEDFSGTYFYYYTSEKSLPKKDFENSSPRLILLPDGRYIFNKVEGFKLDTNGFWKTGGIDEQFEFYDKNNHFIKTAIPVKTNRNNKIVFDLNKSYEVSFIKISNNY
ncbi:MAG: hypothetical protein NWQ38_15775 [Cellulophaga sp.]|nr:hypothetical protein [Cellulophaga sp.]